MLCSLCGKEGRSKMEPCCDECFQRVSTLSPDEAAAILGQASSAVIKDDYRNMSEDERLAWAASAKEAVIAEFAELVANTDRLRAPETAEELEMLQKFLRLLELTRQSVDRLLKSEEPAE